MKVLALVLSTVLATLIIARGDIALVLATPHLSQTLLISGSAVMSFIVYGAVTFGALLTYFDPKRSQPSMKAFRRWATVILAIDVAGLVLLFALTGANRAAIWLPLSFTGAAIVMLAIAFAVGNALRRHDERRDHLLPPWSPVTREQINRKILKIAVTFVVAFVVVSIAMLVLNAGVSSSHQLGIGNSLAFGLIAAFFVSGFACVLVTIPLTRQLRPSLRRDLGLTRKIGRLVLRGKKETLHDDEQVPAARYAAVVSITLPFTLAYIVLLYAGIGLETLVQIFAHQEPRGFGAYFAVLLVVVLVIVIPMQVVRMRRARRYARDHRDLLAAEAAPQA